jgi:hypothetical protein
MQSQLDQAMKNAPPQAKEMGVMDLLAHLQDLVTFTTETQTVKQIPSDPLYFDVPAGYTQTEGGPTPPPALRQSS